VTGAAPRLADPAAALAEARRVAPAPAERAGKHDIEGSHPPDDIADLPAAGLTGPMVPARLGGAGAGFADHAEVALELGAACGSAALIYNRDARCGSLQPATSDVCAERPGAALGADRDAGEVPRW
jgi:alkylation response protein AidB-like acyl-CoA dehydrogenase